MSRRTTKPTKWPVCPTKTLISRLMWVFAGCTGHFIGFVMHKLIFVTNYRHRNILTKCEDLEKPFTVMVLSFRTDRSGQTVQSQIRRAVWSGSTLFAIPSASFGCITLRKSHLVQLLGWLQQIFGCPKFYDFYGTLVIIESGHEKMCLISYANNKGADQPVHPRSLISGFVVHCLDSISLDSIAEISRL